MMKYNNDKSLKTVYIAIVRSILKFNCTPYHRIKIQTVEKVKNKFSRWKAYKRHISVSEINYPQLLDKLSLTTLEDRRNVFVIMFIYKDTNGFIDCSNLLSKVGLIAKNVNLLQTEHFHVGFIML